MWTNCLPQQPDIDDGRWVDQPDCPGSPASVSSTVSSVVDSLFEAFRDDNDDWVADQHWLDDSEAEDEDDVIVPCDCSDCAAKRHMRHRNYNARKYVYGQGTVALVNPGEDVPQYFERGPPSYPEHDQPPYPMSIGQRPYQLWPLPIGQECPVRNSFQGQNPTTDNVVKPTTHAIHGPTDKEKTADEVDPPLSPPKLTGTEPDPQQTSRFGTLTLGHEGAAMNLKTMENTGGH